MTERNDTRQINLAAGKEYWKVIILILTFLSDFFHLFSVIIKVCTLCLKYDNLFFFFNYCDT